MSSIKNISNKALLIILDGFGASKVDKKNAILAAKKPTIDHLFSHYPYTEITAGGTFVGLPKGVAGNSEVGHMNLGAGRPVRQDLVRINESIESHTLKDLEQINNLIKSAKKSSNRIHLMGLLSDGGVHSHIEHIKEISKILKENKCEIFFHAFMDGRDTAPQVGEKYIREIQALEGVNFASMQGRSIGMDRDRRWSKIKHAYDTFTGHGDIKEVHPVDYLKSEYKEGRFDEFLNPVLFNSSFAMKDGDSVFFINFRPDRAIQLTQAMNLPDFNEFERPFTPNFFLCMTPYIPDEMNLPVLFEKEKLSGVLSEYLSKVGKKQLKIAETEKYAHVTFFFNGGEKKEFPNEKHVLINSPRDVKTYDEKPEMSAYEVTSCLEEEIDQDNADFYLVNFANSDMVGHTGNFKAAVKAIEALDQCLERLYNKCKEKGITMLITADHGNSDQMVYDDGAPHTSHTGSTVPFSVVHESLKDSDFDITVGEHSLMDVAPTVLYTMGIDVPEIFEGKNIFN